MLFASTFYWVLYENRNLTQHMACKSNEYGAWVGQDGAQDGELSEQTNRANGGESGARVEDDNKAKRRENKLM